MYQIWYTTIKTLYPCTPSPQGGLSFFPLFGSFLTMLNFLSGYHPTKNFRLVRNYIVRILLYHARALCAREKSNKTTKETGGKVIKRLKEQGGKSNKTTKGKYKR